MTVVSESLVSNIETDCGSILKTNNGEIRITLHWLEQLDNVVLLL